MLNPIKSLFGYLNKNASSVKPDELNMTEELNTSPDADGECYDDPLTDPLALDIEVELNDGAGDDVDKQNKSASEGLPDNTTIEEIIFVDIEKLKNFNHRLTTTTDDVDEFDGTRSSSKKSDINGNEKSGSGHHRHNKSQAAELGVGKSSPAVDGITSTSSPSSSSSTTYESSHQKRDKEAEKTSTTIDKSADNSSVISVISSEPENDEITDISELRSDGSDSGLGSDTLRSVSAIEKNLKLLTPAKSSLKRRSTDNEAHEEPKKPRHSINFSDITVFYFPRCQGFGCVPTQGGSSLGMTSKHAYKRVFTLAEHLIEQRRLNRLKLAGELNESLSSSDESKSEDEISENSFSEGDSEAYGFLQPLTARQRRLILKTAGVKKIDTMEKDDCRQLRVSREVCGCTCRGYCDPDTCECSQAGIKCQVDRLNPLFPCGCNRDGCGNVNGRVEFNPARVKTHFIHTIMRLELEKRQEMSEVDAAPSSSSSVIQNHPKWWQQMRMQQSSSSSSQPQQPSTNSTYSNYNAYNSPSTSSQYATSSSSSHKSNTTQPESLDLHYAYRDDYINHTHAADSGSFSTSANGHDYYTPYYLSTSPQPNIHYQSSASYQQTQTQQQQHLPYYTNSGNDLHYSNYSATNGSNRYHLKNDDINGGYSSYNSPINSGGGGQSRISYQQPELTSSESFAPASTSSTTAANPSTDSSSNQQESNENLCEIIKKSIVETVTA